MHTVSRLQSRSPQNAPSPLSEFCQFPKVKNAIIIFKKSISEAMFSLSRRILFRFPDTELCRPETLLKTKILPTKRPTSEKFPCPMRAPKS